MLNTGIILSLSSFTFIINSKISKYSSANFKTFTFYAFTEMLKILISLKKESIEKNP